MATAVQQRRGTATEHDDGAGFTGLEGEITVDTTNDTIRVHDNSTKGGHRLAKYSELGATITASDESSDTTCFPVFTTSATGALAPKTDASAYTYNAGTGTLSVTALNVNGTVTADALDIDGAVDVNTSNGNVDFDMGSGTFTITSTNTGDQLLLTNTNTGSGLDGAPDIVLRNLYTNVSEIVDNNILGSLHFGGNTLNVAGDAISGTTENFGRILCLSNDVTDGTHDGILDFRVADNGTVATRMQVKPDGIDVTGAVTADAFTGSFTTVVASAAVDDMTSNIGKKYVHTGSAVTLKFPNVTASSNLGDTWVVVNAGTDTLTFDRVTSGTSQFKQLNGSTVASAANTITLSKGGVAELTVIADNEIIIFGSGVI